MANAIALIDLEVNQRDWAANDPWFWPTTLLDNMPNYQKGIMQAMGRFAFELTDQVGRARGSSEADPDLQSAAGLLQYPPDVWVWDPSVSFWPTATSESQYRKAMKALTKYNERLADGKAVFDTRADNLKFTLDRMAADIGSSSSVIDQHIRKTSGFPFQNDTDDIFYTVKGQMYGYYIVLKGLEIDFAGVIKQRDLTVPWTNMMASFRSAIALEPSVVLNGAPDSDFIPAICAAKASICCAPAPSCAKSPTSCSSSDPPPAALKPRHDRATENRARHRRRQAAGPGHRARPGGCRLGRRHPLQRAPRPRPRAAAEADPRGRPPRGAAQGRSGRAKPKPPRWSRAPPPSSAPSLRSSTAPRCSRTTTGRAPARATWDAHMDVNLRAPFVLAQAFAKALPAQTQRRHRQSHRSARAEADAAIPDL